MGVPAYADPCFSAAVEQIDGQVVVQIAGDIDIATCDELRDVITPHLGAQQTMVLDLTAVTFMDSCFVHVMEDAHRALLADGGSLRLRNPSAVARRLLTLVGAEQFLDGTPPSAQPLDGLLSPARRTP